MSEPELEERDGSFVLTRDGEELSRLEFEPAEGGVEVTHVETPEEHRGQGYASTLVERALPLLQESGRVLVSCPYVRHWAEENSYEGELEYTDFLRFRDAVQEFNRYHSPEAEAEVVEREGDRVALEMTGPFCRTCGAFDYLEDVVVDLDAEVESHEEIEDGLRAVYRLGSGDQGEESVDSEPDAAGGDDRE